MPREIGRDDDNIFFRIAKALEKLVEISERRANTNDRTDDTSRPTANMLVEDE